MLEPGSPRAQVSPGPTRGRMSDTSMKIVLVGHGMVGHKFLEELRQLQIPGAEVTVLCEEPRVAYDRVHLSEFFAGKTAEDLSLVAPGFFAEAGFTLRLGSRAAAIDRRARTVTTQDGVTLPYDKLVLPRGPIPSCRRSRAASATSASSIAPSRTSRR